MKTEELQQKLSELDPATLQGFILDLYIKYPDLSIIIETLVLFNDPSALKKAIAKRIQSVKRGSKFIDYYASSEFALNLESIVDDIENGLLIVAPKDAFELIDKFLATADSVMNRVDDSSGEIGDVYSDTVTLWLKAAKMQGDTKIDWLERVYQLYQNNDYGVLDSLLPNSDMLLSEEQLKQLAWRYEGEIRQAQKKHVEKGRINMESLSGRVALGSIAMALKDPVLYEHSVLMDSPQPNDLQKKSIIAVYIEFNQPDKALHWLNTDWESRFESDRLQLQEQIYEQNENTEQLRHTRQQIYQLDSSYTHFLRYIETLDEDEKHTVEQQAIKQAEKAGNILTSADLLLQLGETERAQQMLVSRYQELTDCYYESLIKLVKQFEKSGCLLATTACYRVLLEDILNRGNSKAYTHAARYFKKLQVFADEINNFEPLIEHSRFIDQLKNDHGKKYSFWQRVS
jgi:chemotaxis protein histidine kinase CheA